MSSARTYLLLLLGITGLVAASGGMGYYFFAILPQKQADVALPEARILDALADPSPAPSTSPDTNDDSATMPPPVNAGDDTPAWAIGPSARESRFGFKAPAARPPIMAVPARSIIKNSPRNVARRRSAGAPMALPPLYVEQLCEDYSGEFDLAADGAALDILPSGGSVTLRIHRERIDLQEHEDFECGDETGKQKISDIEPTVDVSLRLIDSGSMTEARPYNGAKAAGEAPRFVRWHSGGTVQQSKAARGQAGSAGSSEAIDAVSHYAIGADPSRWFTDVNGYPVVQYPDIYPGINLDCYAERNRLEFIYTISPNADPRDLQMAIDGSGPTSLDAFGNMETDISSGKLIQYAPRAFRIEDNHTPVPVNARFEQQGAAIRLDLPDTTQPPAEAGNPRTTGPHLEVLSYLGGEADDAAFTIAIDHKGFTYVAGQTTSRRFAGTTPDPKRFAADMDVFVTKFRNTDGHPVFTTLLGGAAEERALDLVVAQDGSILVCGETLSRDFPVIDAPYAHAGGQNWDAFLTRLSASGAIVQSDRMGGSGDDHAHALALRPDGAVVVAGDTTSTDFAGLQPVGPGGGRDAFVLLINDRAAPAGIQLGGSSADAAYSVAIGPHGQIALAGETASADFPVTDSWQNEIGGEIDAFVATFTNDAHTISHASFVGAENDDRAYSVAFDSSGYLYLTGETASLDLPTVNPLQDAFGGGMWDVFLCKFNPQTLTPLFLTYFGGSGDDRAFAVVPNAIGEASIAGETSSTNLPVYDAVQENHGGGVWDGFSSAFNINGSNLVNCTYLGGAQADHIYAATMEAGRRLHVAGQTASTNLLTMNAIQSRYAGGREDSMLAVISPPPNPGPPLVWVPASDQPDGLGYGVYVAKFETTNAEFARFLNDAQVHTNDFRGTNLYFDAEGNIWFNPAMRPNHDEVFSVAKSRIEYHPDFPLGSQYTVTSQPSPTGGSYTNHPAAGLSWYGAVKYCNWLTIDTGRGAAARCFQEGTNALDWRPVTCASTNWARGIITPDEREALLEYGGYRLPMDNCASSSTWDNVYLSVSNEAFVDFLNGMDLPPADARDAHVFVDQDGNAWFNRAMLAGRDELFLRSESLIQFAPMRPLGSRFYVARADAARPVNGVSPFGAMKYCNWLSLRDGIPEDELAYREGPWQEDWAPATCGIIQWRENRFGPDDYQRWIENVKGYRLPIKTVDPGPDADTATYRGTSSWPNPFNEFYAAAAWNGSSNTLYAFGRNTLDPLDANYRGALRGNRQDTLPVGYFDGEQRQGYKRTHTNQNAYGIYDLSGNVSEWLLDFGLAGSPTHRATAGGSFHASLPTLKDRTFVPPYLTDSFGGVRPVISGKATGSPATPYVVRIPFRLCLCPYGEDINKEREAITRKDKDEEEQEEIETALPGTEPDTRLRPPEDEDFDYGGGFYRPREDDDDDDDDDVPVTPGGDDDDDDDDDEPVVSESFV